MRENAVLPRHKRVVRVRSSKVLDRLQQAPRASARRLLRRLVREE